MELFYYTSTDTMSKVLTNGNIYATNIRYMNDSEEYINGLEEIYNLAQKEGLIKKWLRQRKLDPRILKKIQEVFTEDNLEECRQKMEYYSISFCKKNDLLSQWAIYAKESGVSIKMNFEKDSYNFLTKGKDYENNKNLARWDILPQKVYYFTFESMKDNKEEYESAAFEVLDQLYGANFKDLDDWKKERWRYVSTLVKRYDFYQEEESRLVFEPNESAYEPIVQYRHDHKILKPYLDIECKDGWPIWEIMIGPGFNQQVVYDSVNHFLSHVKIKNGIKSTEDYVKRVNAYLKPYKTELKKCRAYEELKNQTSQKAWIKNAGFGKVSIFLNQKIEEIKKEVCCEGNEYSDKIKQYFKGHCFTTSGIVLTKSSIPYIF